MFATSDVSWLPGKASAESRRDFLYLLAGTMGAVGAGAVAWPLIDSMNPAADVRAVSSTEVDIAPIALGQRITIVWRGSPVFIDHRTPEQIARARADDSDPDLIDPATDVSRVKREEWLIVIGVCRTLAAFLWDRGREARAAIGVDGFVPAMDRTMILQGEFERDRRRRIWLCHPTSSMEMVSSVLAEWNDHRTLLARTRL